MATDKYSNIKQNGGMKKFGYCWLCEKFEALRFSLRLGKNRRRKNRWETTLTMVSGVIKVDMW